MKEKIERINQKLKKQYETCNQESSRKWEDEKHYKASVYFNKKTGQYELQIELGKMYITNVVFYTFKIDFEQQNLKFINSSDNNKEPNNLVDDIKLIIFDNN